MWFNLPPKEEEKPIAEGKKKPLSKRVRVRVEWMLTLEMKVCLLEAENASRNLHVVVLEEKDLEGEPLENSGPPENKDRGKKKEKKVRWQ